MPQVLYEAKNPANLLHLPGRIWFALSKWFIKPNNDALAKRACAGKNVLQFRSQLFKSFSRPGLDQCIPLCTTNTRYPSRRSCDDRYERIWYDKVSQAIARREQVAPYGICLIVSILCCEVLRK